MVGYPWLIAWALRELLPGLNERFADQLTLSDYYPVAACLVALLIPNAMGIVLAFQLLEEKDVGSLVAVAVTPMSLDQCFLYRTVVYVLVSVPLLVVLHELLGVVALGPGQLGVVALAATPIVPPSSGPRRWCPWSTPRRPPPSSTGSSVGEPWPGDLARVESP